MSLLYCTSDYKSFPVASIPIFGRRSLRPVKNREGSFNKVADQNCPYIFTSALFFTGQSTPLTKLSP